MNLQKGQGNLTLPNGVTGTFLAKGVESGYFIVTRSPSDGIVIKKLDDSDNVEWTKAFGSSASYTPFGTYGEGDSVGWVSVEGVQVDGEGYVYVAGSSTANSSYWFLEENLTVTGGEYKSTPFILKIDPNGRLAEAKNIVTFGDTGLVNFYIDEDNGYMYAGVSGGIVQIDPIDLSISRVIESVEPSLSPFLPATFSQARTKDGGFLGVLDLNQGSTQKTFNGQPLTGYGGEIAVVKLTSNGRLEWSKLVAGSGSEVNRGFVFLDDGSFVILGYVYTTNASDQNRLGDMERIVGEKISTTINGTNITERGFLSKYDSKGNHVWTKNSTAVGDWVDIVKHEGDEVTTFQRVREWDRSQSKFVYKAVLSTFDATTGVTLSTSTLQLDGAANDVGYLADVILLSNGQLKVASSTMNDQFAMVHSVKTFIDTSLQTQSNDPPTESVSQPETSTNTGIATDNSETNSETTTNSPTTGSSNSDSSSNPVSNKVEEQTAGAGNQVFAGSSDKIDVVIQTGNLTNFRIQKVGNTVVLTDNSGSGGTDTLVGIERVRFSDKAIAFDTDGATSAGGIYRLYKATFNREPDTGGLGYWINEADLETKDAVRMAEDFVWSQEFQNLYGITTTDNYGTGNNIRALIEGFYENVLGRTPDQGGLDYYTGVIGTKEKTVGRVLAEISDSQENYDATIELIVTGIIFDPYTG